MWRLSGGWGLFNSSRRTGLGLLVAAVVGMISGLEMASAQGGQLQYVTVTDAFIGVPEGKMPFFAGWRGAIFADHSDQLSDFEGLLSLSMTSPDGSETIRQFGRPLHTAHPLQTVMAHDNPGTVLTRFSSTAEILTRYILPKMQLGGEVSAAEPFAQDTVAKLRSGATAPGFFADGAAVLIRNVAGGREIFLWGVTAGREGGTTHETSRTFIQLVVAPAGKARALAAAYRALPPIEYNPEWTQRGSQFRQQVAQMSLSDRQNYNIKQGEMNRQNNESNEMARENQWERFNGAALQTERSHQAAIDAANLQKTQRAGLHSRFAWCNAATGDVQWSQDSLGSPGAGYERCPNRD